MELLWTWLLNSVAVFLTAKLLKGVEIKNFWSAIGVAALLALVNTFIKPVLEFISLPFILLTLGLFVLVINALLLMLVDKLVDGFKIENFGWAVVFSIVLSFINAVLTFVF